MSSSLQPDRPAQESHISAVDGKIKIKMLLLLALLLFKLYAMVRLIQTHEANPAWMLVGVVVGVIVGIWANRSSEITWDHSRGEVVSQMDVEGVIVMATYIVFVIFQDEIAAAGIKHAASAGLVVTTSSVVTTLVRLWLTYRSVGDVLREAGLLPART